MAPNAASVPAEHACEAALLVAEGFRKRGLNFSSKPAVSASSNKAEGARTEDRHPEAESCQNGEVSEEVEEACSVEYQGQSAWEYQCLAHCGLWYFCPWKSGKHHEEVRARTARISNCPIWMLLYKDQCDDARAQRPRDCDTVPGMTRSHRHEARVAWPRAKRRLDELKHSWKATCGPLTATIQTLRDSKWKPRKLDLWFQQDGTSWFIRDVAFADSEEILMELASCLQQRIDTDVDLMMRKERRCQVSRAMKNIAARSEHEGLAKVGTCCCSCGTVARRAKLQCRLGKRRCVSEVL